MKTPGETLHVFNHQNTPDNGGDLLNRDGGTGRMKKRERS
jgi:hypothetical protein